MDPKFTRRLSLDKDDQPGCLWGVVHVLRSYQWHNVKKMMPNKKLSSRKHSVGGSRHSRLKSNIPVTTESQGSFDDVLDEISITEMTESSSSSNRSSNAQMKNLMAEEFSKERNNSGSRPTFHPYFLRTDSIHHLEPSNPMLPDEVREGGHSAVVDFHHADFSSPESKSDPFLLQTHSLPVTSCNGCELCNSTTSMKNLSHNQLNELGRELLGNALLQNTLEKAKECFLRKKSTNAKGLSKNTALSKEVTEALEMFNANNGLFQKTLVDADYALADHFKALQTSNSKKGLTKSVSFPSDESSFRRNMKSSEFKYVRKEVRFFDDSAVSVLKQSQVTPDLGPASRSSSPGARDLKKRRFKNIKKRIINAIKERKEGHRISMDAVFHKMPYGSKSSKEVKRGMSDKKESVMENGDKERPSSSCESNKSTPVLGKDGSHSIRRTRSLNESLNRYSQLYELSFGRANKQHPSKISEMANVSEASSVDSDPKALGRIMSLPDLQSNCSLEYNNALSVKMPNRVIMDSSIVTGTFGSTAENADLGVSTDNDTQTDASAENGKQENLVAVEKLTVVNQDNTGLILDTTDYRTTVEDEMVNDLDNLTSRKDSSILQTEAEIRLASDETKKQAQPSSLVVLDSCCQENISSLVKPSISEGLEFKPMEILTDELDSVANLPNQSVHNPALEKVKSITRHLNIVQVDKKDEADFNYVRDVLKLSGFSGKECLGTWYSPDQPVDPSLFEEVESFSPLKPDYPNYDHDHQLLFDIINEVLLEIYDKSFTYWPWPLSCNCHIRPKPTGYHVLEEVWSIISWYLSSQPEFEPLDYLVVRDLSKNDGWMNLQFESECVGIELEDMILDDLLDELVYE